jgi:hypothetical protein
MDSSLFSPFRGITGSRFSAGVSAKVLKSFRDLVCYRVQGIAGIEENKNISGKFACREPGDILIRGKPFLEVFLEEF